MVVGLSSRPPRQRMRRCPFISRRRGLSRRSPRRCSVRGRARMADADRYQAHGGKTVYGACVGILMLETRFPRIPGDIGHAATWPFPVLYKVVRGATAERVTTARANDGSTGLLDAFLAAGAELGQDGPDGITTSCGFLSIYQRELAEYCGVPVAASSLIQIPLVE